MDIITTTVYDIVSDMFLNKFVKLEEPIYVNGQEQEPIITMGCVTDIFIESDTYHMDFIRIRLDDDMNKEVSLSPDTRISIFKN